MRYNITNFRRALQAIMPLERGVRLRLIRKSETPEGWAASHDATRNYHEIVIAKRSDRNCFSLLAHEWIHAYLLETDYEAYMQDHGPRFQNLAYVAETLLRRDGWQLGEEGIYLLGVDCD